jgi:hypothetical protein
LHHCTIFKIVTELFSDLKELIALPASCVVDKKVIKLKKNYRLSFGKYRGQH